MSWMIMFCWTDQQSQGNGLENSYLILTWLEFSHGDLVFRNCWWLQLRHKFILMSSRKYMMKYWVKIIWFSLTNAYKIKWSLCLINNGKIDPTSLPMWDKRCCIRSKLHMTYDITEHSKLLDDFWVLRLQRWKVERHFKISKADDFFICDWKHQVWVWVFLVKSKGTFWYLHYLAFLKLFVLPLWGCRFHALWTD